jgi:hypothetical protein
MANLSESMIAKLKAMASRVTIDDLRDEGEGFPVENVVSLDDAYNQGGEDAETYLAREILFELGLYVYGEN